MGGQTTLEFWQLLLLAVGPAFLTACVAMGAPLLLEGRKQEAEKRKKRAEKIEELITRFYEFDHWVDRNIKNNLFGEKFEVGTTPLAGIQGIVSIYFPQFKAEVEDISVKGREYSIWSIQAGQKRLANDPQYTEGQAEAYKPYRTALINLIGKVGNLGQE